MLRLYISPGAIFSRNNFNDSSKVFLESQNWKQPFTKGKFASHVHHDYYNSEEVEIQVIS